MHISCVSSEKKVPFLIIQRPSWSTSPFCGQSSNYCFLTVFLEVVFWVIFPNFRPVGRSRLLLLVKSSFDFPKALAFVGSSGYRFPCPFCCPCILIPGPEIWMGGFGAEGRSLAHSRSSFVSSQATFACAPTSAALHMLPCAWQAPICKEWTWNRCASRTFKGQGRFRRTHGNLTQFTRQNGSTSSSQVQKGKAKHWRLQFW